MRRLAWFVLFVIVGVGGVTTATAPAAWAACHAFEVAVNPAAAPEGAEVTVTVTRDAPFGGSSVEVTSVDESARAGEDFPEVRRTIDFTSETEQTFPLALTDDPVPEGEETFRLHLSDGGGCTANTNFTYGPDARVTIQDNDTAETTAAPAPPPTPPAQQPPARQDTATTAAATTEPQPFAGDDTTTTAPGPEQPTTTAPQTTEVAARDAGDGGDGGGGSGGAIAAILIVILAALGGGGYYLYRRSAVASH